MIVTDDALECHVLHVDHLKVQDAALVVGLSDGGQLRFADFAAVPEEEVSVLKHTGLVNQSHDAGQYEFHIGIRCGDGWKPDALHAELINRGFDFLQFSRRRRNYLYESLRMTLGPGLAILITAVAINLFGDFLRDTYDPRLAKL